MMKTFEQTVTVTKEDLDELNHVNNVVYLQWIQDVAKAHWLTIAPKALTEKYIWMVLRHEIDYRSQAFLDDTLQLKTWVNWSEGVKSERAVEISNLSTGKIIIQSKTTWCLLDASSKRPHRIEKDITEIFH